MRKVLLLFIVILLALSACSKKEEAIVENSGVILNEEELSIKESIKELIFDSNDKLVIEVVNADFNKLFFEEIKELEVSSDIVLDKEGDYTLSFNKDGLRHNKNIIIVKSLDEYLEKLLKLEEEKVAKEEERLAKKEELKEKEEELVRSSAKAILNGTNATVSNTSVSADSLDGSVPIIAAAKSIVGESGRCSYIVDRAYKIAYPDKILRQGYLRNGQVIQGEGYIISEAEAVAGDLILWDYSEVAQTDHVALYLGNGLALHGNLRSFDKKAAITGVHLNNMGTPVFFRPTLRTAEEEVQEKERRREEIKKEVEEYERKEAERKASLSQEEREKEELEYQSLQCDETINIMNNLDEWRQYINSDNPEEVVQNWYQEYCVPLGR